MLKAWLHVRPALWLLWGCPAWVSTCDTDPRLAGAGATPHIVWPWLDCASCGTCPSSSGICATSPQLHYAVSSTCLSCSGICITCSMGPRLVCRERGRGPWAQSSLWTGPTLLIQLVGPDECDTLILMHRF